MKAPVPTTQGPQKTRRFIWSRALSIARKEVRHVVRDPFTLLMALGVPVVLVVFFGYAIDFNVRNIKVMAIDADQTRASRDLLRVFSASDYFRVVPAPPNGGLSLLDQERAKAAIFIKPGFEEKVARGEPAVAQLVLDGADNQTTGVVASYLAGLLRAANEKLTGEPLPAPGRIQTRFLYNSELNSRWFVVPGLTVVVIGILSILLTALTVAREWENGSMELLLSTPVRPLEIIVGKLLPYAALGLFAVAFVYVAARLLFGIPFRGSHLLFLFTCLAYLGTTLAQGLVISVVTRQQQIAMQVANITGLLPNMMLSGFIFPVQSMPAFFQKFTMILAPRWFMAIARGIYLKGAGAGELAAPIAALLAIDAFLVRLAVKKFKTDLEP
ncbi:MAG: ABC transporter permease [Elusimicrobia bacterium]|nr:ABC transporter permease [Elusimicrobiota bacterium]